VRRVLIVAAVIVFVLAMASALLAKPDNGRPPPDRGNHSFTISGDVAGLVPLVEGTIEVIVTNRERFDIVVDTLGISVGDASTDCGREQLVVGTAPLPAIIPARSDSTLVVTARLAHDVPDACQGIVWPLTYTGTASRP
jgi:hypothetical protein